MDITQHKHRRRDLYAGFTQRRQFRHCKEHWRSLSPSQETYIRHITRTKKYTRQITNYKDVYWTNHKNENVYIRQITKTKKYI